MYSIDGWIDLLDADSYLPGEDWQVARDRENSKLNSWKKRIFPYESTGLSIGIKPMNGASVFIVHTVHLISYSQLKTIRSLISEIAMAFCESRGLLYIKRRCRNNGCSYFVIVVKNGAVSVRHDPFLTDAKQSISRNEDH